MAKDLPQLKVSTGWIEIEVLSEALVVYTYRGYAPCLRVRVIKNNLEYLMYISAKSISKQLEELRSSNNNYFTGLKLALRKEGEGVFAKYEFRINEN